MLEITVNMIGLPGSGKTRAAVAICKALRELTPGFEYDIEIKSAFDGESKTIVERHECKTKYDSIQVHNYGES